MTSTTPRWATTIAVVFAVAACGGGEDGSSAATDATPAATDAADTEPETTEAPLPATTEFPTSTTEPEPEATEATEATEADATDEPTTTTEAPTTTTPEPATSLPDSGAVEPGRYAHPLLEGLVLTTDGGLTVETNQGDLLALGGEALTATVSQGAIFLQTVGIIPPSEVGIHQEHHPTVPEVTVDLPDDLSIWFDAIPQVTVLDVGELTVAGQPARWWTLTVDPDAGDTFNCGFAPNCIGFVVNEQGGTYVLADIDINTVFQFDAAPDVIGWAFAADEPGIAEAGSFLESVLAGLEAV